MLSGLSGCGGASWAERLAPRYQLEGDGIGNLRFSQGPERVERGLEPLLGPPSSATGATTRGLGLDEPLGRGRQLYGRAFVVTSRAQGTPPDRRLERLPASEVHTARGRIYGFIDAPGGLLSTTRRTIGSISAGALPNTPSCR